MVKKGIKQFLAGMCAVLVMPTGTVQNVLAKESEQALPVSAEKSINQELKLWYMILSILVYTFFSRMFDLMLPPVAKHSIVVA